jgi:Adenylate cyclase, family 3 (some proteins contain HAMP domain)
VTNEEKNTFLFADLAGFTALTEAHGDQEAVQLADEFYDTLRRLLPGYRAEEVKTIGDAMMIRAHDARRAVELGLRIVDELGARPNFPIVRVGMHTGSAIERGGDWFGAAVNLAARISASAGGKEVLLSEATRKAAGNASDLEYHRHGTELFKNVREPVRLYRAVAKGKGSEELPIDPVCRMAVDVGTGAGRLSHGGREFYFCSLDCARQFAADPDSFAARP